MLEIIFGCFYFQKMLVLCSFLAGCSTKKLDAFGFQKLLVFWKKASKDATWQPCLSWNLFIIFVVPEVVQPRLVGTQSCDGVTGKQQNVSQVGRKTKKTNLTVFMALSFACSYNIMWNIFTFVNYTSPSPNRPPQIIQVQVCIKESKQEYTLSMYIKMWNRSSP